MQTIKSSSWANYWQTNPEGFNEIMNLSTKYFANKLNDKYPLLKNDRVLDIGCGPGFLFNEIVNKVDLFVGTDISDKYIEICKNNNLNTSSTHFVVSKAYDFETYRKLILDNRVNKVVMLSVLQYYQNKEMIIKLINNLKEISKYQKFTFLIADIIPENHSIIGDIVSISYNSVKKNYTLKFIKFLCYALFSDYRKIKKNGLLNIKPEFFVKLANDLNVKITVVKNITIHSGRYSVLLDFN